jgi:hypothetical protein
VGGDEARRVSTLELLTAAEVRVYFDAVGWVIDVVRSDEVKAAWTAPSALTRMSTGAVAAHAVHGVRRLEQTLQESEPTGRRQVEMLEYYGPNRMADSEDDDPLFVTLREGAEKQAARGRDAVLEAGTRSVAALRDLLPRSAADRAVPVLRVPDGQVALSDYLRTRILELMVHGDDIVASVGEWPGPEPPAEALRVCLDVCLELAEARAGGMAALRSFTRGERATPGTLRVL